MLRIRLRRFACAGFILAACQAAWAEPQGKPDSPDPKAGVAAYVAGKAITIQELDAKVLKTDMKLAQSLYDARREALEDVVMERILAPEAAEKGIPVEQLLSQRIAEKAKPVTDAEVEEFYNKNRGRMRGQTLEQVTEPIRGYLGSQRETEARKELLAELEKKVEVRIVLDPPRADVSVSPDDPVKGPADATVTIVEFSEFQ